MKTIDTSIIISTYNSPDWLQKVLWSYDCQTFPNFEVIVADDGSSLDTKALIDAMRLKLSYPIRHIWHEDDGFQKTKILNKAILETTAAYIIFTDGDCIARQDFVETHMRLRQHKSAISGGYFKLDKITSDAISKNDIEKQRCFNTKWLSDQGLKTSFKMNKLSSFGIKARLLNKMTPTKATFDGMNVSAWKQDIMLVNGFDERMQYGGEDRELGERLMNVGITFIQARYSVICVHLFHERPYKNEVSLTMNKQIRQDTKSKQSKYTNFGIIKPNL